MGGIGDTFSSLSWVMLLGAGITFYQLSRSRHEFWGSRATPRVRQLAGGVAFFLLVPLGVLLHEFGHILAAWSTGSRVLGLHYFAYWGYVEYIPANNSPLLDWYVALAGNFASYLLGIVCLVAALALKPSRPAVNITLAQLGILELVQTLIFYPLISLDPGFQGDWDSIYSFQAPIASGLTLAVHLLSLAAFVVFMRSNQRAKALLGV